MMEHSVGMAVILLPPTYKKASITERDREKKNLLFCYILCNFCQVKVCHNDLSCSPVLNNWHPQKIYILIKYDSFTISCHEDASLLSNQLAESPDNWQ